jgi:hypothetical protein
MTRGIVQPASLSPFSLKTCLDLSFRTRIFDTERGSSHVQLKEILTQPTFSGAHVNLQHDVSI